MFRHLGLTDTKLGMILLYTAVNVSLAVWLLKGFMDEIPREYEEAAMVGRLLAPAGLLQGGAAAGNNRNRGHRDLLPDLRLELICLRGPAHQRRRTNQAALHTLHHWRGGQDWPAVAAATTIFFIPILCFTILLRRHLLRGITLERCSK